VQKSSRIAVILTEVSGVTFVCSPCMFHTAMIRVHSYTLDSLFSMIP